MEQYNIGVREKEPALIVMKFGGSSLADAQRIRAVAEIVGRHIDRRPVVVVSALGAVTDLLEGAYRAAQQGDLEGLEPLLAEVERRHRWALAGSVDEPAARHQLGLDVDRLFESLRQQLRSVRILGEGTPRVRDLVLAHGETLSARIVESAFIELGLPAERVDPQRLVTTDDRFGAATPDPPRVREQCEACLAPFIGASRDGQTTTLGRGGSDTTAAVLGMALEAEEIQIWTDVDGLMSADPRLVASARTLSEVSFAEAAELALYGARVLHPESIAPAVRSRIPVCVRNSLSPEGRGTRIVESPSSAVETPVAVASKREVALARVTSRRMPMDPTLPGRVLAACADADVVAEMVLSSATSLTVASSAIESLRQLPSIGDDADVEVSDEWAIVCVVGSALSHTPALAGRVLGELTRWQPELIGWGATRTSVIAVLPRSSLAQSVRALHEKFFEEGSTA
jgi:aspartate kinase